MSKRLCSTKELNLLGLSYGDLFFHPLLQIFPHLQSEAESVGSVPCRIGPAHQRPIVFDAELRLCSDVGIDN